MSNVGWMDAACTLFCSIILSTLTYGCQAFVFMTKKQSEELESACKDILYRMLRISKYTQYAAVLLECNLMRLRHTVNQLKICFIRNLIHDKGHGFCLDILREEEKLFPGTGQMAEVKMLCEMYGIGDVTTDDISLEYIKSKIWEFGRMEIWKETLTNSRIPKSPNHLRHPKFYMKLPRYQSKLFFAYRVGELQLKDFRRGEFSRRFGNSRCFTGCLQADRLDHVMTCEGYPADIRFQPDKFEVNYDPNDQKVFISYLVKLDAYRAKAFSLPLLFRVSKRKMIEKRLGL